MVILIQNDVDILTPELCSKSDLTQDIVFFDLCADYDLQVKLNLVTAVFLKPVYNWQEKTKPEDMPEKVAIFLAQFSREPKKLNDFLMTNPVLRILWKKQ